MYERATALRANDGWDAADAANEVFDDRATPSWEVFVELLATPAANERDAPRERQQRKAIPSCVAFEAGLPDAVVRVVNAVLAAGGAVTKRAFGDSVASVRFEVREAVPASLKRLANVEAVEGGAWEWTAQAHEPEASVTAVFDEGAATVAAIDGETDDAAPRRWTLEEGDFEDA